MYNLEAPRAVLQGASGQQDLVSKRLLEVRRHESVLIFEK